MTETTKSLLAMFSRVYARSSRISRARDPYDRVRNLAMDCIARGVAQVRVEVRISRYRRAVHRENAHSRSPARR